MHSNNNPPSDKLNKMNRLYSASNKSQN